MVARLAEVEFVVDTRQLESARRELRQLREQGQSLTRQQSQLRDSFEQTNRSSSNLASNVGRVGARVASLGATAGAAAAGGLGALIRSSLNTAQNIQQLSRNTGFSTERIQELQFAANRLNIETQALNEGLREFSVRLGEAARGEGEAAEALDRLGLSAERLNELRPGEALNRVISALNQIDNRSTRVSLIDQIFGGQADQFESLINTGVEGINELGRRAEELGLIIDNNLINQAAEANEKVNVLADVIATRFTAAVAEVSPQINTFLGNMLSDTDQIAQNFENIAEFLGIIDRVSLETGLLNRADELRERARVSESTLAEGTQIDDIVRSGLSSLGLGRTTEETRQQIQNLRERATFLGESIPDTLDLLEEVERANRQNERIGPTPQRPAIGGTTPSQPNVPTPEQRPDNLLENMNRRVDAIRNQANATSEFNREIRNQVDLTNRQAENQRRLLDARRQGEDAVAQLRARIEAENTARQLGIQIGSEEFDTILQNIQARRRASEQREQLIEQQRKQQELEREGQFVTERFATVEERRARRLSELRELLNANAISTQTFNRAVQELNENMLRQSDTISAGFQTGLLRISEEMNDLSDITENLVVDSFQTFEDTLVQAFTTGRVEAEQFFNQILADLARLAVRATVIQPILGFLGLGGGGSGIGNIFGFAQGGVISSPTAFSLGGNNVGIAGEGERNEAILPLERTSSGDLGVNATGGNNNGASSVNVSPSINVNIEASGSVISSVDDFKNEISEAVGQFTTETIIKELNEGGLIDRG